MFVRLYTQQLGSQYHRYYKETRHWHSSNIGVNNPFSIPRRKIQSATDKVISLNSHCTVYSEMHQVLIAVTL